jgi:hypothetical protein
MAPARGTLGLRDRTALGLLGLGLVAGSGVAPGAVESFSSRALCGGRRFERSQALPLARGASFDLVVSGFGVDNADRVEAISLPGVKVRIAGRRSFPEPQLTVAVKVEAGASLGKGELRLRYPVEVAGYDRIGAEIVAAVPCATPGGDARRP